MLIWLRTVLFFYAHIHEVISMIRELKIIKTINHYYVKGVNTVAMLQSGNWKTVEIYQHQHCSTRGRSQETQGLMFTVDHHVIFMPHACRLLLRHPVDGQSHINPRSKAALLFSLDNPDDTQTSWPLSWQLHCSSINEDLLLYWLMVHFSSAS